MSFEPYVPDFAPEVYDPGYVQAEFQKISELLQEVLNALSKEYHAAPEHPYNHQLVLADGTDWDPGSGRGIYWYDETPTTGGWKKL